jgi:hypothetical protein
MKPEHARQTGGNGGPLRESPRPAPFSIVNCFLFIINSLTPPSVNTNTTNTNCFSVTHLPLIRRQALFPRYGKQHSVSQAKPQWKTIAAFPGILTGYGIPRKSSRRDLRSNTN